MALHIETKLPFSLTWIYILETINSNASQDTKILLQEITTKISQNIPIYYISHWYRIYQSCGLARRSQT